MSLYLSPFFAKLEADHSQTDMSYLIEAKYGRQLAKMKDSPLLYTVDEQARHSTKSYLSIQMQQVSGLLYPSLYAKRKDN